MNDKKPTATAKFLQILGMIFLGIIGFAVWAVFSLISLALFFPEGFPHEISSIGCEATEGPYCGSWHRNPGADYMALWDLDKGELQVGEPDYSTVYCTDLYMSPTRECASDFGKQVYVGILLVPFAGLLLVAIIWALFFWIAKLRKKK